MKMKNTKGINICLYAGVLCSLYFGFSTLSYASCAIRQQSGSDVLAGPVSDIVSLTGATIAATPDLPVGTVLYVADYQSPPRVTIDCTTAATHYVQFYITSSNGGNIGHGYDYSSGLTSGWRDGVVYSTNLPGIGAVYNTGSYFADNKYYSGGQCSSTNTCGWSNNPPYTKMTLALIKTGPISPGVVNGDSIPDAEYRYGQMGSMIAGRTIRYTGGITITVPTCTTPDVSVDLGSWPVEQFTGKNSVTPWHNFPVVLTNCGNFSGYYGKHITTTGNKGTNIGVGLTQPYNELNQMEVTITPLTGVINSAEGIMGIISAGNSASGVGIQLGYVDPVGGQTIKIPYDTSLLLDLDTSGVITRTIPLAARYIQTENTVSPGRADARATLTISYK